MAQKKKKKSVWAQADELLEAIETKKAGGPAARNKKLVQQARKNLQRARDFEEKHSSVTGRTSRRTQAEKQFLSAVNKSKKRKVKKQ